MHDVLFMGSLKDPVLEKIWNECKAFKNTMLFDVDQFPLSNNVSLQWVNGKLASAHYTLSWNEYDIANISGIFCRVPTFSRLDSNERDKRPIIDHDKRYNILFEWLHFVSGKARVVASLSPESATTTSKPLQLRKVAYDRTFSIPPTIISNNSRDIKEFCEGYCGIVQKSISDRSCLAKKYLSRDVISHGRDKELILIQQIIEGSNVRVHIIGKKIIAFRVMSDALDYRSDVSITIKLIELPSIVAKKCMSLCKRYKLQLCGIDLIQTKDEWYFLEINPQPAFTEFDDKSTTKLHIDALYSFLRGK